MSKKNFSLQAETDAMGKIAAELEKLPQDSKQRIANWLLSIVNVSTSKSFDIPHYPQQDLPEQVSVVGPTYQKGEQIKEFFHGKQPKNNYQKLAVLGYYLEFMKGKDEFNTQDLKIAWRQTREALPSSQVFSNSLSHAVSTYNYFVSSQRKGFYRMGIRGQNLVESLPTQSKTFRGAVKKRKRKPSSRKIQK